MNKNLLVLFVVFAFLNICQINALYEAGSKVVNLKGSDFEK